MKIEESLFIKITTLFFILLSFYLLKDLLIIIISSFIISYLLFPLYEYMTTKLKNKSLASILTIFITTFGLFIPLFFIFYFLFSNIIKGILQYQQYLSNPIPLNNELSIFLKDFLGIETLNPESLTQIVLELFSSILELFQSFVSNLPKSLFLSFIILFLVYYILVDYKKIGTFFRETIPVSIKKQNEIIANLFLNLKVLFIGYFLTSIIQTILAIIGYLIFGIDNILLWGFLTFILAILPYVGTIFIWGPISFYLIIIGDYTNGIGLIIYGLFIISSIDKILRPILMSGKDTLSPPFVFVGIIGGLFTFGIIGLILGPIILSLTLLFLSYIKKYYSFK